MRYKFYPSTLITLAAAGLVVALLSVLFYSHVQAAPAENSSDKLITVHDGGQEKVILTREDTLGQALDEAGITVDSHDTVEPATSSKLVASSYQVNIYRAKPVIVIDGTTQTRIMTSHKFGRDIAKEAGVTLRDEDTTEMKLSMDIVSSGPATQLIVHRAVEFKLDLYGDKTTAYTQGRTVAEMLEQKGIKLTDKDGVTPSQSTAIEPGMTVKVWRDGKQTITKKETIKHTVRKINDVDRPVGYKKVKTEGVNGQRSVTYEVVTKHGKEVSRQKIQSVTLKKPVAEVVIVGTKSTLPPGSHKDWMSAAGISPDDYGYVNYIFKRESGWRPHAENPGLYYGLGQTSLKRMTNGCGADWASDPICQIKLFDKYAKNRYGNWKDAYEFKKNVGWW